LSCVQEGAARSPRPESRARSSTDSSNECARCQTESARLWGAAACPHRRADRRLASPPG
jgi:hypothetical protein